MRFGLRRKTHTVSYMNHSATKVCLAALLFLGPFFVGADDGQETSPGQRIDAVIQSDLSVRGRWTFPVNTAETDIYTFPEYKEYGFTSAFSYKLVGAENENGPVLFSHEVGDFAYVNTGYPSGHLFHKLYLTYEFKTPFTSPFVLYEFMVFGGGFFHNPTLGISYPSNLTLVSSSPPAQKTRPVEITYPPENSNVYPVVLLFRPNPLPPGVIIKKEGPFTIVGDAISVERIAEASKKLGELSFVMSDVIDAPLPSEIFVLISDLDAVKLNFEAAGLAIRPNIILLNRAFLAQQEAIDVQLLLSHEAAHLSEMGKGLFSGASYYAPWFREGLATAVEIEMRNRLLKTREERVKYDTLGSYNSHVFSATEAQNKYKKDFDFILDGNSYYSTTASYAHGALVLRHLFQEKGKTGMKDFLTNLRRANSSQLCLQCDSELILQALGNIGGWDKNEVLFPFRDTAHFAEKAKRLIQEEPDDAEEERLILSAIETIPHYFTDQGVNPNPAPVLTSEAKKTVAMLLSPAVGSVPSLPVPVQKPASDTQKRLPVVPLSPIVKPVPLQTPPVVTKPFVATSTPTVEKVIKTEKKAGFIQRIGKWFKR